MQGIVSRCAPENRSYSANWLNGITTPTYRSIYIGYKKFVAPLLATTAITQIITLIEYRRYERAIFRCTLDSLPIDFRCVNAFKRTCFQSANDSASMPLNDVCRCSTTALSLAARFTIISLPVWPFISFPIMSSYLICTLGADFHTFTVAAR